MSTVPPFALKSRRAGRSLATWRHMGQVPLFVVGVVALLGVAVLRPLGGHGEQRLIDRELAAARKALGPPPGDVNLAGIHAERALEKAAPASRAAGEAHFLLGSAYLLQAEAAPAEASRALWEQAREHLEAADGLNTTDTDRARLAYRLGKTHAALQDDPHRVVACLSWSVPDGADNPFDGYSLLAQACLKLPTPDVAGALAATRKQLALPTADEAALAGPRLTCGELLVQLGEPDEARKVLARIGTGATPEISCRSRLLRARLAYEDGAWAEAASLWEAARADAGWEAVDPARSLYALGLCYTKLKQNAKAAPIWEECQKAGGEEGQAASLQAAELRLSGDDPSAALEAFAAAVRQLASPSDYHNSLIDLAEARNRFESACQRYRQKGLYEPALQLARLYERIALPGVGQELAGQAAEAWARALLEQSTMAVTAAGARQYKEEAQQRYREAGAAFERAAELSGNAGEQGDWLWRAANDYFEGQDRGRAVVMLERFVKQPQSLDERRGQAWFLLGEAHRLLRNDVAAQGAYQKCIEFPGLSAHKARYELAMVKIADKKYDDAVAELIDNLRQAPPSSEPHEKSLVTLANLQFQRGDWLAARRYLDDALRNYPANPQALRLRLQYAQSCWQLAKETSERDAATIAGRQHYRDERSKLVELAGIQYKKLADDVDGVRGSRPLSAEEELILRQALFAFAECRFELGKIEEALGHYNGLADRYKGQLEELTALRHVWQCHGILRQPDQIRTTLERVTAAVKEMPASAFHGGTETARRDWWETWVREMGKLRDTPRIP